MVVLITLLSSVTGILLVPIVLLLVECGAALVATSPKSQRAISVGSSAFTPTVAILVPAHNEAQGIQRTLETLLPQLNAADRLIVIADNCSDETAVVARQVGAFVLERQDAERRGKGYALDFGLQFLRAHPPDVVIIVDADCLVAPGAIAQIAQLAAQRSRPVQATYLLEQPPHPKPKDAVSAFAFTVKNLVRPQGLRWLGQPCLLTGTGMAFPWSIMQTVSLASGNIVEDMQLAVDFAIAGTPALFCAEARVTGALPQQQQAATSQRTRWEHGHLQTLKTQVPRLLKAALKQRRLDLLVLSLDLAIPPLSLLVMLWGAIALVNLGAGLLSGVWLPASLSLLGGSCLGLAIITAWSKFCRQELPLTALLSVPLYILWKVPLYLTFLIKPQTKWVRTERDH